MRPSRSVQRLSSAVGTAVLAATAAAALVGCQPPVRPAPPAPAAPTMSTSQQAEDTRNQFVAIDPNAQVGRVDAVDAGSHMAVVAGIPLAKVKVGDTVSFTGPDHQPFATGTITILDNYTAPGAHEFLDVDYQKSSSNGRDPTAGDLAIVIPLGH